MGEAFGDILREWRGVRRLSQLQLSLEAGVSARHVSFLESGRASPSRAMVARLAEALSMPKEIANRAMHAAGYAPAFPQFAPDDAALDPVRAAVTQMLRRHEPLPAVAIDRRWDILEANEGALRLFEATGLAGAGNLMDALIAAGETDVISNWEEVAFLALSRLRAEIIHLGGDRTLARYAAQLAARPRFKTADPDAIDFSQAVIPTRFAIGPERLALFTTIASFGAVQDVMASEIRVEMMFPLDAETRAYFDRS